MSMIRRRQALTRLAALAAAGGLAGPALAGAARPPQEKRKMIETRQALDAALKASAAMLDRQTLVNIVVDTGPSDYTVALTLLAPADRPMADCIVVKVDGQTGVAAPPTQAQRPNPLLSLDPELRHSPFLTGMQAYQAALQAIKGYEHYDKFGRLTVRLTGDHYEVMFPDPAVRTQGGHTSDYTYLVWLHARTGAVMKILVAS